MADETFQPRRTPAASPAQTAEPIAAVTRPGGSRESRATAGTRPKTAAQYTAAPLPASANPNLTTKSLPAPLIPRITSAVAGRHQAAATTSTLRLGKLLLIAPMRSASRTAGAMKKGTAWPQKQSSADCRVACRATRTHKHASAAILVNNVIHNASKCPQGPFMRMPTPFCPGPSNRTVRLANPCFDNALQCMRVKKASRERISKRACSDGVMQFAHFVPFVQTLASAMLNG